MEFLSNNNLRYSSSSSSSKRDISNTSGNPGDDDVESIGSANSQGKRRRMAPEIVPSLSLSRGNFAAPAVSLTVVQQPGSNQPSSISLFMTSSSNPNQGSSSNGNFFSGLPTFSKHSTNIQTLRDDNDIDEDEELHRDNDGDYYEVDDDDDEVISQISDEDPISPRTSLCSSSSDIMDIENDKKDENGNKIVTTKRRIYHRRANPFPRVLKRDIRRDYGAMLVNVMNSFDGDLTAKFFNQFCVKNCYKLDLFPEVTKHYNLPGFRHVDGLNKIVYHLLHDLSHIPDSVFRIKGSHIRQRSDIQGSQVCVRVLFQGTKIYTNESCNVQNLLSTVEAALQQQGGSSTGTTTNMTGLLNAAAAVAASGSNSSTMNDVINPSTPQKVRPATIGVNEDGISSTATTTGEDDCDDNQSVVSALSTSTGISNSSMQPSGRSLWMPVPPELDEKELNALDIQTLHRHLKSFAMRQQELSSLSGSMGGSSAASAAAAMMLAGLGEPGTPGRGDSSSSITNDSNSISGPSSSGSVAAKSNMLSTTLASLGLPTPPSPLLVDDRRQTMAMDDEELSTTDLDITKDEWYENRGITLLPKPFQITVDGTIIMHLDEDHRIHRLEFVSSSLLADMNDTPGFSTITSTGEIPSFVSSSNVSTTVNGSSTSGGKGKREKGTTFHLPGIANPHLGGGSGRGNGSAKGGKNNSNSEKGTSKGSKASKQSINGLGMDDRLGLLGNSPGKKK